MTAYYDKDYSMTDKFIYEEEIKVQIYNFSQTVTQQVAPIYYHCAMSTYTGVNMVMTHFYQFNSTNYFMLSCLENFLSNVFYLNAYYNAYLASVEVNDVNVQYYYIGTMIELLVNFDMIEFEEVDEPEGEWDD